MLPAGSSVPQLPCDARLMAFPPAWQAGVRGGCAKGGDAAPMGDRAALFGCIGPEGARVPPVPPHGMRLRRPCLVAGPPL